MMWSVHRGLVLLKLMLSLTEHVFHKQLLEYLFPEIVFETIVTFKYKI
jgi:hypothetical protein